MAANFKKPAPDISAIGNGIIDRQPGYLAVSCQYGHKTANSHVSLPASAARFGGPPALGTSASLPEILQCLPEGFAERSVRRWLAGLGVTREEYQRWRDRQTEPPSP